MKLYFIRHGESEANVRRVISNRESPFMLTPLGRQQTSALAENLRGLPVTAIFLSPILRAKETAQILSKVFGRDYTVTEALREYDCGILEDKSDTESWNLHREIAEDWVLHHNYGRKPEGGENFFEIQNRFIPFIKDLVHQSSTEDNVLLIGHGGLFHLMLPLILNNIDDAFVGSHGMCHTEYVFVEAKGDSLICRQWGPVRFDNS